MNLLSVIVWGFAATCVLTTLLIVGRSLHLTRIDIPFILGTAFTSDRNKAKWIGSLLHFIMGWNFAFIYALAMETTGLKIWWFGMLIGLVHAATVLTFGMNFVSYLHPRMATEDQGPDPTRVLEPPGFMITNYGYGTPIATLIAHIVYGGILGTFYS